MIIPSNEFIKHFREVHGAMSVPEMIFLYNCSFDAPFGKYVELGSHRGKSSMAIALGMKQDSKLFLVEPEFSDHEWNKEVGRLVSKYTNNPVLLMADYSTNVLPSFEDISFCFVDSGSHQDGLPMQEVKMLEDRMKDGGIIVFHDLNSQFKEVRESYDYLKNTGKYSEVVPDWERIISYVRDNDLEKGNSTWHHTELEFPTFIGALRKKEYPDFADRV
jgi:predicted O-methyltransferase YrrM